MQSEAQAEVQAQVQAEYRVKAWCRILMLPVCAYERLSELSREGKCEEMMALLLANYPGVTYEELMGEILALNRLLEEAHEARQMQGAV